MDSLISNINGKIAYNYEYIKTCITCPDSNHSRLSHSILFGKIQSIICIYFDNKELKMQGKAV